MGDDRSPLGGRPRQEKTWQPNRASSYLEPLNRYTEAVLGLFPALPKRAVANASIFPVDAIALGYFLERCPRRVVVLEVGSFVGASAFFFASHPKVERVISVDPNLPLSDELVANSGAWEGRFDAELLEGVRAFDVARAALAQFGEEREKIEFREGVIGSTQVGIKGMSLDDSVRVEAPAVDPGEADLVVLVDALHTREGVRADLQAVFGRNPRAVAFLDDCRHAWGAFVQAGVVEFMEQAPNGYHFQLIGDLGPGLARSNLGVVYPDSIAGETRRTLSGVASVFSERLDPLRLLEREEELITAVSTAMQELQQAQQQPRQEPQLERKNSRLKKENDRLRQRNTWLKQKNSQLIAHYSSRRYFLADALVGGALRVPGVGALLRQDNPSQDR